MRCVVALPNALALTLLLVCANAADVAGVKQKSLRTADEGVVTPLEFNQRLLVCNAYPSERPAFITKNQKAQLVDASNGIGFRQCNYIKSNVQQHDKLDFALKDTEVQGTFEVGELPASDAVLLLVLQKREAHSPMMAFQSFAFPTRNDDQNAQLAVIDTFRGNSSTPHLRMADHLTGKEQQTVSKRVEQLNFNRVYAIEEGTYDASVMESMQDASVEKELENRTKAVVKLLKNQNYVVLRTGDGMSFSQSLMVFPEVKSAAARTVLSLGFFLCAFAVAGF